MDKKFEDIEELDRDPSPTSDDAAEAYQEEGEWAQRNQESIQADIVIQKGNVQEGR